MQNAVHLLRLIVLVCVVSFCARGQGITIKDINQDTDIARHDMKLAEIEGRTQVNTQRIDKSAESLNELRLEIASAKYAVYGFGLCLTFLQGLQVLAAFKKPREPRLKDGY